MKKVILSLALVAVSFSLASAQTDQGNLLVGGSIGGSTFTDKDNDTDFSFSSFELQPNVGYFVADNLAIGLGLGFSRSAERGEDENGDDVVSGFNKVTIEPFGRYYVDMGDGSFKFFAEARIGLGFGNTTFTVDGDEPRGYEPIKTNLVSIGINPGFAFFPTEHFGVEFTIGGINYLSVSDPDDNDSGFNVFSIGTSPLVTSNSLDQDDLSTSTLSVGSFLSPKLSLNFYF